MAEVEAMVKARSVNRMLEEAGLPTLNVAGSFAFHVLAPPRTGLLFIQYAINSREVPSVLNRGGTRLIDSEWYPHFQLVVLLTLLTRRGTRL